MGTDFSGVRVHARGPLSEITHAIGARALTVGADIAFAPGEWAPETRTGRTLLAHELAHVVIQAREGVSRLDAKTLDEDLDEALKTYAAKNHRSLDPQDPEYARTLQGYGFELTHDTSMTLHPEPKDPKAREVWKRKFTKSELLAGRILSQSGAKVEQKESRAQMLANDLAISGFVDEAMALARQITSAETRSFVYDAAMDRPDKITPAQVAEITKFHASRQVALTDHPVLSKLRSDEGAYAARLTAAKVNAALDELVKAYEGDPKLPEELARALFFTPGARAGFTSSMIGQKKRVVLRKVAEANFFVEGANIGTSKGVVHPSEGTLVWAISTKQKVAVEDILALTSAAGLSVKPPKASDIKSLKAWLDTNTEIIGQAIRKQHPTDPGAAEAMLQQITGAFMFHVDPDAEDITPDKGGKIARLEPGGTQKSQLKVDCDVLATYSVRLLVASGFTPVGYMAVVPTDTSRAAHAMAILRNGGQWHAVSNVASRTFPATTTKDKALTMLRDFGIDEAYDASRPLTGYQIYYQDTDAKGTLPDAVLDHQASTRMPGLRK